MADRSAARAVPGVVRIIGGRWKRTPLAVVDAPGLRPTPNRVRATLFDWLDHHFGGTMAGRDVLDLFAGTGALGFEAASRGAAHVVMVESDARVAAQLEAVVRKLGASDVRIMRTTAARACTELAATERRFDAVLLDPPFDSTLLQTTLVAAASLCASGGLVYAESSGTLDERLAAQADLEPLREKRAGAVVYHLLRRKKQ